MPRESDFERIVEVSYLYPIVGLIASIFPAGIGYYFINKGEQAAAKPVEMLFNGTYLQFGKLFIGISGFILLVSVIGWISQYLKGRRKI